MRKTKKKGKFKCEKCPRSFKSRQGKAVHEGVAHGIGKGPRKYQRKRAAAPRVCFCYRCGADQRGVDMAVQVTEGGR